MTMFGGVLLYLGLLGAAAGLTSLLKPMRFLGVRTRKKGLLVSGLGFVAFAVGVYLPATETRVETPRMRLDEFAPAFQFSEFHRVSIDASKDRVYRAIRTVTPDEIRFYKTLTWMRRFGKPTAGGIFNPPGRRPILDTFIPGAFVLLADDPGREIVFGRAGGGAGKKLWAARDFAAFHPAPYVKIVANFRIEDVDAAHCTLTTETRIYAAGSQALHGFAAYWRMIYPGSSLIRRERLRTIQRRPRAEARR